MSLKKLHQVKEKGYFFTSVHMFSNFVRALFLSRPLEM